MRSRSRDQGPRGSRAPQRRGDRGDDVIAALRALRSELSESTPTDENRLVESVDTALRHLTGE